MVEGFIVVEDFPKGNSPVFVRDVTVVDSEREAIALAKHIWEHCLQLKTVVKAMFVRFDSDTVEDIRREYGVCDTVDICQYLEWCESCETLWDSEEE